MRGVSNILLSCLTSKIQDEGLEGLKVVCHCEDSNIRNVRSERPGLSPGEAMVSTGKQQMASGYSHTQRRIFLKAQLMCL